MQRNRLRRLGARRRNNEHPHVQVSLPKPPPLPPRARPPGPARRRPPQKYSRRKNNRLAPTGPPTRTMGKAPHLPHRRRTAERQHPIEPPPTRRRTFPQLHLPPPIPRSRKRLPLPLLDLPERTRSLSTRRRRHTTRPAPRRPRMRRDDVAKSPLARRRHAPGTPRNDSRPASDVPPGSPPSMQPTVRHGNRRPLPRRMMGTQRQPYHLLHHPPTTAGHPPGRLKPLAPPKPGKALPAARYPAGQSLRPPGRNGPLLRKVENARAPTSRHPDGPGHPVPSRHALPLRKHPPARPLLPRVRLLRLRHRQRPSNRCPDRPTPAPRLRLEKTCRTHVTDVPRGNVLRRADHPPQRLRPRRQKDSTVPPARPGPAPPAVCLPPPPALSGPALPA